MRPHEFDTAGESQLGLTIDVLGAPAIWTPNGQLATTRPIIFSAALYLGFNRGKMFHRLHLSALLWPDVEETTRNARMRWLLHQLRATGLTIPVRSSELHLRPAQVTLDIDAYAAAATASDVLELTHGPVLCGYDPRISDVFSRWLEASRNSIQSRIVHILNSWLTSARRASTWAEVEELARRILVHDEFHEHASKALKEAGAMRSRDRIIVPERDAAPDARALQRSAFVGRSEALHRLVSSVVASRLGERIGICGPAGIGKSRLLDEFANIARLRRTHVVRVRCESGDGLRPLSLAVDLARALLEVRGAVGASPEAIATLRRFIGEGSETPDNEPNEARRAAVYTALTELVRALTDETSLAVVIDDAQWAEGGSWSVLAPLFLQQTPGTLSWIVAVRAESREVAAPVFQTVFRGDGAAADRNRDVFWLTPMDSDDIAKICTSRVAPRTMPAEVLDGLIPRALGNPFIAEALADHWMDGGDISSLPASVARLIAARLDRLAADATSVLETVAVLGPDAELSALESVCLIERLSLLKATRELEATGILRIKDRRLTIHSLWSDAVLARAPRTTITMLHRYAAQWLQHDAAASKSIDQGRHWAIATHWLEAGDPQHAVRALDRAAGILSASGFASQAAAMLERCAELSGVSELGLEYLSRAAALWLDEQSNEGNAAVARIHLQYDHIGGAVDESFSRHHEVELLALHAFNRQNVPQDEKVRRYMPCVMDEMASTTHRIHAAAQICGLCGRGEIGRSMASRAWKAIAHLVPETPKARFEAALCAALHSVRVAQQPDLGLVYAERARKTLAEGSLGDLAFRRVMVVLSECHEHAGNLDLAQSTRRELYERGKQSRNQSMMMFALDALIGTALEAGRPAEARALLALFGRPSAETRSEADLSRTIHWVVCALEEGDATLARADLSFSLDVADNLPDAMPRARILAIYAHLALLEDDHGMAKQLMPRLLDCFSGKMLFMHHPAYVAALCLSRYHGPGDAAQFARRFIDEISLERWPVRKEMLQFIGSEVIVSPPVTNTNKPKRHLARVSI